QLWFADDHDRGVLDVQSLSAGLDLCEQHSAARCLREVVDDLLAAVRAHRAADRPVESRRGQQVRQGLDHRAEEGEDDDLAAVLGGVVDDLAHPVHFVRRGSAGHRGASHAHEAAGQHLLLVGGSVLVGEFDPVLDLVELGQLLEDVLLVAAKVGGGDVLPERQRRQALGGAGEVGIEVADEGAELLQSVLDRGARHEDRVVGTADLLKSAAGTSSGGVLDLVRLVDHERVQVLERAVSEEAERVAKVVTATPPSRCHSPSASARSGPCSRCAVRWLLLLISRSQFAITAAGQITRVCAAPWRVRWAIAASASMVLPSPISSPMITFRCRTANRAPKCWYVRSAAMFSSGVSSSTRSISPISSAERSPCVIWASCCSKPNSVSRAK